MIQDAVSQENGVQEISTIWILACSLRLKLLPKEKELAARSSQHVGSEIVNELISATATAETMGGEDPPILVA